MTRCVVNVADKPYYYQWQDRLLRSLQAHHVGQVMFWRGELPMGSPTHKDKQYAFKLFAIAQAFASGADSVLWMDSGLYCIKPIAPIFECIEKEGLYVVRDSSPLSRFCNPKTRKAYGVTDEEAKEATIACGSILGFGRGNRSRIILLELKQGMRDGYYDDVVSARSGIEAHRGDEAILGCLMYKNNLKYYTTSDHFGSDSDVKPQTLIRSGYYHRDDEP